MKNAVLELWTSPVLVTLASGAEAGNKDDGILGPNDKIHGKNEQCTQTGCTPNPPPEPTDPEPGDS